MLAALRQDVQQIVGQRGIPRPDAILATGDIAFSGGVRSQTEYREASDYLRTLRELLHIPRERAFVVAGNHDVQRIADQDRGIRRLLTTLRRGEDLLDEVLTLEDERLLLARRQHNFRIFAQEFAPFCLPQLDYTERLDAWACRFNSRGLPLRLVGLNTAILAAADDDQGKLCIGLGALEQTLLNPPVSPDEVVIALGHHPLRGGWLRNEAEISGWMRKYTQAYLSGHIHTHESEQSRFGNSFVWLSAGSAHAEPSELRHGYNLAGLYLREGGKLALRVWPRVWDHRSKRFVADLYSTPDGQEFAEHELGKLLPSLTSFDSSSIGRDISRSLPRAGENWSVMDRRIPVAGQNAKTHLPTRASLRQLIYKVLPTDSDFVAFCIDHFPSLARRYSSGMDLTAKINLLFQIVDLREVLELLERHDPERFKRHKQLLEYVEES